ncbi:MAG: RidA family protein [Pseudomonadota bacterium]
MSDVEAKLKSLGISLPEPKAPVANYVPFVIAGDLVFISGQVSFGADGLITGKVGDALSVEDGVAAARVCGVNLLAQLKVACDGDLNRLVQVVKLGAFVNCGPDFTDQPAVANGASDLMVEVFGDAGRHARAAVGAPALPLDAAVEIDGVFQIR